jgi:DNA-binding MarR family transcriptional regulator
MEAAGHVVQERSPDDGRSRVIHLTSAGTRLARRIEQASRDRFRRIACRVPASERQALFDSLTLLNAAVEALGDEQEKT